MQPPAYQPYAPQSPYPQQVLVVQGPPTSSMAVISLVSSILGLLGSCCTFGIPSLLAVVLGHLAMKETRREGKGGHGMAVAGLTMGYIGVAPAVFFSAWMIFGAGLSALGWPGMDATPTPTP